MLFMWDDVYSTEAGKNGMSGSGRQVSGSIMNNRKKEMFNGIHAFVRLIFDEFHLPPYAAHVKCIIYECDGDMIQTFCPVRAI
jgi:hypothetical protein